MAVAQCRARNHDRRLITASLPTVEDSQQRFCLSKHRKTVFFFASRYYYNQLLVCLARLRSSSDINFLVPRRRTKTADRLIVVVSPKWWNMLPSVLKSVGTETTCQFKLIFSGNCTLPNYAYYISR